MTVRFGVFRVSDNKLLRTGTCSEDLVDAQAVGDDERAEEGDFTFGERAAPVVGYRMRRADAYPSVGEQLGAIVDLAKAAKEAGVTVPKSVEDWLENVEAVKAAIPKEDS